MVVWPSGGALADNAARATTIVDDDLLPQGFAQPRRDRARGGIGRAARRKRHHHAYGSGWVLLREGVRREARRDACVHGLQFHTHRDNHNYLILNNFRDIA
jgi:hypothetical protein